MDGATITFGVSLLGIISMFAIKLVEVKTGRASLMSRISDRTNHIVHAFVAQVKYYAAFVNKKNAVLLFKFVVYHVLLAGHRAYIKLRKAVKAHLEQKPSSPINVVLGKGVIKKKGSVSFFLKHIAEESKKREITQ